MDKHNKNIVILIILILAAIFLLPYFLNQEDKGLDITFSFIDAKGKEVTISREAIVDELPNQYYAEIIIKVTNNGDVPLSLQEGDISLWGPNALMERFNVAGNVLGCTSLIDDPNPDYDKNVLCGSGVELGVSGFVEMSTGQNFPDAEPPILNAVRVSDIGVGIHNIRATAQGRFVDEFGTEVIASQAEDTATLSIYPDITSPSIIVEIQK